ncbi:MAG: hypothetical protein NT026_01565, partial [Candidatus Staskawiczbacteria bacterium]|nr:hypothetical protein [Candidatus Staskawiczbacteria bacterium]
QLLYECIHSDRCYQCQYGIFLRDCISCMYCYDCRSCQNCFLSSNLRNKQYYFLNKQYTKEDYEKKIKEFNLGSFASRANLYEEYVNLIKKNSIHRFAMIEKSNDVSGNIITNSKRTYHAFEVSDMEDGKYSIVATDVKDSMDGYKYGFRSELIYECHALIHDYNVIFSHLSYDNSHLQYCDTCHNSENLFGCVCMKQGKYAILNKQYPEKEYHALREKIIEHMKSTKEYGEFFPLQLSPFGYNETQGQIHKPLTKEDALSRGFKWVDQLSGTFGKETIKTEEIPDDIKDVNDSILKEALRCVRCGKNYNIVKMELDFYQHENIPIPRQCPDCRYFGRVALRLPYRLWYRQCMCDKSNHGHTGKCSNEFETSYAPDRPEIVYCESCYQAEVI